MDRDMIFSLTQHVDLQVDPPFSVSITGNARVRAGAIPLDGSIQCQQRCVGDDAAEFVIERIRHPTVIRLRSGVTGAS